MRKTMEKNIHTWVFCFLLGALGVDRFIRGILKLITSGCFGIWVLVDWIIAMVKAYGDAYGNEKDFVFINGHYSK